MKVRFQIVLLVGFLALFSGTATALQAQTKVGYTNVELLLNIMPETQQIEKQLQVYEKKLTESLQAEQTTFQTKVQEYQTKKQNNQLSPAQEEAYIKELTAMEQNLQKGVQEAEYKLMVKREELLKPLTSKVQNTINEIAADQGYTYVLNQTMGGGITNILYGLETNDITPELAKRLGIKLPEGDGTN